MRAILAGAAVAVLVVAVGGSAVGQDEKIDGKLLIGKWTPEDKEKGLVIEFAKDGKLSVTAGEGLKLEGSYKLEGNKLTLKVKFGDDEKAKVRTVHSLTKDKMVSSDEGGKKDTLLRVTSKD
jgi:uncharacterized protein (TIGR03066 family)